MSKDNLSPVRENWSSRFGYIMSMLGMAIGLGAIWRFPILVAENGGGAFVIAFFIIAILISLPGGWAEIGLGRWAQAGPVKAFGNLIGFKGRVIGGVISLVPMLLNMYYLIVVGWVVAYAFYSIPGTFYADPVAFFTENIESNKTVSMFWTFVALGITTIISMFGIKRGIERFCKIALPLLYIILVVLAVRICMLPGVEEGLEFFIRPDFTKLLDPEIWMLAAGMAFFAFGLGPAFLEVYGSYLKKDADVTFDFVTVTLWNMMGCLLAGLVTIPALFVFDFEIASGSGLVFQVLPKVFEQIAGGHFLAILFFVALVGAGISTTIAIMEITVAAAEDFFGWKRKRATFTVAAITALGSILCVMDSEILRITDWIVGNIGYNFSAAFTAILLAWYYGAKRVRDEFINPGSEVKIGSWFDIIYKFPICILLLWFCYTAIETLVTKGL